MNICPICQDDINYDTEIIIKHGNCRYVIHKICYNSYNKCIYCKSSTNPFYEQLISYIFIDEFLNTLVKFVNIELPNSKSNIFSFVVYLLFSFVITFLFLLPTLILILVLERYQKWLSLKIKHFENKTKKIFLGMYLMTYWLISFSILKYLLH
jgi:hypothetical protein